MKILSMLAMASVAAVAAAQAPQGDDSFLHKAVQVSVTEIEAAKLALRKGTSDAVKRFGEMMLEEHTTVRDRVEALAQRKNVELPPVLSDEHRETIKRLHAVDGPRFDQRYVAEMVKAHEQTLEMLESEIASGRDADTQALAQELLPTARSHLREAYRLAGEEEKAAQLPR